MGRDETPDWRERVGCCALRVRDEALRPDAAVLAAREDAAESLRAEALRGVEP